MISSDLPITKSSEDIFNRSTFANSLAQAIISYSDSSSFTIGLYGPWGSGKTSLLNMIVESVDAANSDIIVLRFNPWLCSEPKQLITQFFKQLSSAIKLKKSSKDRAWELIDQYGDVLDAANSLPIVGQILTAGGKSLVKKAKKNVENRSTDLQAQKDQITNKMIEEELRILVLIDDIDRLSEEEIISVFQLVKSLADFPNMVYILAFDYSVVVKALSTVQHGDGKEYLEKIVQVPFEIPAPGMETVYDFLVAKLNSILTDVKDECFDQYLWADLFQYGLKKYIKSVRDVIRYTNVLAIKYQLLKEEVNPVDLLGITCLQVFEPFVYSKLPEYKDIICGYPGHYSYDFEQKEEQTIKKVLSKLTESSEQTSESDAANYVLGLLFPKIKSVTGSVHAFGRVHSRQNTLIMHKVSASECFDRYFALSLEKDAISHGEIMDFLFAMDEKLLSEELMRIYQQGKLIRLLEEIEANAESETGIPEDRAKIILKVLFQSWNQFEAPEQGFFGIPFSWRLLFCSDPLLKAIDPSSRFSFVNSLFEDQQVHPSTLSLLLQYLENQHGRFNATDAEDPSKDNPLLFLDSVLALEEAFKHRAFAYLESIKTLKHKNDLDFLWMLGQIDGDLTAKLKKQLVFDDSSLIKIIGKCTSRGKTVTSPIIKTRKVNREALNEFIEPEEAYRRVNAFIGQKEFYKLSSEEQYDAAAFVMGIELPNSNSSVADSISDESIRKFLRQRGV